MLTKLSLCAVALVAVLFAAGMAIQASAKGAPEPPVTEPVQVEGTIDVDTVKTPWKCMALSRWSSGRRAFGSTTSLM